MSAIDQLEDRMWSQGCQPAELAVLRDALLEAGHPRGEIIDAGMLGDAERVAKLTQKHLTLLVPKQLLDIVERRTAVFEHGYLVAAEVRHNNAKAYGRAAGHRALRALRRLNLRCRRPQPPLIALLRSETLTRLEVLTGVIPETLIAVANETLHFRSLAALGIASRHVGDDAFEPRMLEMLPAFARRFPAVRELGLGLHPDTARKVRAAFSGVQTVHVEGAEGGLRDIRLLARLTD